VLSIMLLAAVLAGCANSPYVVQPPSTSTAQPLRWTVGKSIMYGNPAHSHMEDLQVRKIFKMNDNVFGGCVAVRDKNKFLNSWFDTNCNPCSACHEDKHECLYYKKLEKIVMTAPVDEEDHSVIARSDVLQAAT